VQVNNALDSRTYSKDGKSFDNIPPHAEYSLSRDPALIYYCENETVDGVQFSNDPNAAEYFPFALLEQKYEGKLVPLVADYSSSFLSRRIPRLADHAVIFAGAQKNLGPAGLTVLIVRQDCVVDVDAAAKLSSAIANGGGSGLAVPLTMAYKTLADSKSLYNTPSVLPIYIAGLVLEKLVKQDGGIESMEAANRRKQEKVYKALREGMEKGVFEGKVQNGAGSWMNVVFGVLGEGAELKFLEGAEKEGMKGLKGHRCVFCQL
jgi:phosphoserine aminotransferase